MDGIILINKPKNCSSHDIVYKIKKITDKKVGHTGTLDPNATGILPILIGKGTQLSKYLINHNKEYEVVLKLGKKTDTADNEGNIIEEKEVDKKNLDKKNINNVLKRFIGKQEQMPPMYSAIKVNGKKLYEYARKEEQINVNPRKIEIYSIELQNVKTEEKEISFIVKCSKGTYIRSLCEDIAQKLGTVGYMKELNRTKVGQFILADAITVEEFEKNYKYKEFMEKHLISIENLFKDNLIIKMDDNILKKFLNGVKLKYDLNDGIYKIYNSKNNFIGIGTIENKILKRDIII